MSTTDESVRDSLNAKLPPEATKPINLHLDRQRALTVDWADGRRSEYPLVYLRSKCPCAGCRTPQPPAKGTSLNILPANFNAKGVAVSAALVGNYALQIRWGDGHDTGIYDFGYLRAIDPALSNAASRS